MVHAVCSSSAVCIHVLMLILLAGTGQITAVDTTRLGPRATRQTGGWEFGSCPPTDTYIWFWRLSAKCHRKVASCMFTCHYHYRWYEHWRHCTIVLSLLMHFLQNMRHIYTLFVTYVSGYFTLCVGICDRQDAFWRLAQEAFGGGGWERKNPVSVVSRLQATW